MPLPLRRIVTGHDAAGRSVIVSDGPTPNTFGPAGDPVLINFWATFQVPADPRDPTDPAAGPIALHSSGGGATFRFFRVPPEASFAHLSDAQRRQATAAYYAQVGAADAYDPAGRHPGFHRTHSVDFIVLLDGEVTLMLDATETDMKPFDVVIQRGTSHAWVNRGERSALMMAVLLDGGDID